MNVYVGRTRVQAPVTNGDNVTMIASSIQDAINAVPALPFTASSSAGVVTLTARHKGLCGNEIPVSLNYYGFGGGEVLPAGVQIAVATGTAGTGAPVLTGAVAAMADEPFDYIGLPFNDTASVNTLVSASAAICNRAASGKRTVKPPPRRRSSVTWLPAPFVRPQSAKRRMPSHDCLRPQLPR